MILYSSRRRQVFLYTPLDHIPAIARAYYRGNIAAWRWIRANIDQLAPILMIAIVCPAVAIISYGLSGGRI